MSRLSFFVVKYFMRKIKQQENNTLNRDPYQLCLPMDVGVKIEADEPV